MKKLLLLLLLLIPLPAHAGGVLVLSDSLMFDSGEGMLKSNIGPFIDLLQRSMKPGKKLTFDSYGGTITASTGPTWTLTNLTTDLGPTGAAPRFDYDLLIIMGLNDNEYVGNDSVRPMLQISLAANRPKIPVLYISVGSALHNGSGLDSLGVNYANVNISASSPMWKSPAGFAFPVAANGAVRRTVAGGAGDYVTRVLSLYCTNFTKADPDGQRGEASHPGTDSDTLLAWFYNPPIVSTRVGIASAKGYGVCQWEDVANNRGTTNYPSGNLAPVAVGMAAYLAPTCFKFPAQNVAVDIDDGTKRFSTASSLPQVVDALAGLDSLNAWRIPYTYCIETDSMNIGESNGLTRFQNEAPTVQRARMGHFTVHNHAGTGSGGAAADTSLATASGGVYVDIFGVQAARYSLIGVSAATRDKSTLWLLNGATKKLIDYVGDVTLVSSEVVAPTDNYRTLLASVAIKPDPNVRSNYDSVSYACRLAGAGYKGFPGYTVIRTQYQATSANASEGGGTGGIGRGFMWPLPSLYTIAAALDEPLRPRGPARILYAPSQYLWGGTTDTNSTVAQAGYNQMRKSLNQLIGNAVGYNRNVDMTTAQEDPGDAVAGGAHRGFAKGVIWVTHLPNWRTGIGITNNGPYSGQMPAWENVRLVHSAMEAGRWCAMQANTATTTYFTDGPIKWVWGDRITEKDVH